MQKLKIIVPLASIVATIMSHPLLLSHKISLAAHQRICTACAVISALFVILAVIDLAKAGRERKKAGYEKFIYR